MNKRQLLIGQHASMHSGALWRGHINTRWRERSFNDECLADQTVASVSIILKLSQTHPAQLDAEYIGLCIRLAVTRTDTRCITHSRRWLNSAIQQCYRY